MKKFMLWTILLGTLLCMASCTQSGETGTKSSAEGASGKNSGETEFVKEADPTGKTGEAAQPTVKISWARDNSGNIFQEVAMEKGWFKEEGVEISEKPLSAASDALTALTSGNVDVISNYGTNVPLQNIAAGEDLQIVGGYMATGCMPIITKASNNDWKGVESLIGKKVAADASEYTIAGPLLEKGFDPVKDIEWVNYENFSDMTAAVLKGEVDYAIVGTSRNFEIQKQPELKVVAYKSDLMPWYSCCRMVVRSDFAEKNPDTLKKILKLLLRAQAYYEASDANKEECKKIVSKRMNVPEEYLSAYMDNEHFRPSVDPLKHEVDRAWDILGNTGFLNENWKNVNVDDHIQQKLYKEALDEAEKDYGEENPDFYRKMQEFYAEHDA